jgi:hypothetical protein
MCIKTGDDINSPIYGGKELYKKYMRKRKVAGISTGVPWITLLSNSSVIKFK